MNPDPQSFQYERVARAICDARGFEFSGAVGHGAFKETYAADEEETRHAVKIFRPGEVDAERILREVTAMLRCNHSNIARLRAIARFTFETVDYLYCVEEFLAGGTLTARVSSNGLLSLIDSWEIGRQLISAVGHIASLGLVHRDIKPDNIMLREDGRTPVIVDFGIVRALDKPSITVTWAQRGPGTPYFAPPEQLRNEKSLINWRADQFSLAVSLAKVSMGLHPFASTTAEPAGETVARVAERQPLPSTFIDAAKSFGLPVLARMLAPWPVSRFRLPEELAQAWAAQREQH